MLTLAGIVISSASIYWFSDSLHFAQMIAHRHPHAIARLKAVLDRYELPLIVGWSFFPLVPTDAICYVCGALRVHLAKFLLGIAIGEGAICALYIFLGDYALRFFHLRP